MKAFSMHQLMACFVLLLFTSPATGQEPLTEAKRADIMRLVQVTGSGQIGLQFADVIVNAITDNMKTVRPDIPPRVSEIVKEEVNKLLQQRLGTLLELLVPVYHENLTHEEIKGLLQFYGSPLGRTLIQKMPAIVQRSMVAGQTWGESLSALVQERLRTRLAAEGYK